MIQGSARHVGIFVPDRANFGKKWCRHPAPRRSPVGQKLNDRHSHSVLETLSTCTAGTRTIINNFFSRTLCSFPTEQNLDGTLIFSAPTGKIKTTMLQWVNKLLLSELRFLNEFLIDVFSCIEDERLASHAKNQDKYTSSLHDAFDQHRPSQNQTSYLHYTREVSQTNPKKIQRVWRFYSILEKQSILSPWPATRSVVVLIIKSFFRFFVVVLIKMVSTSVKIYLGHSMLMKLRLYIKILCLKSSSPQRHLILHIQT